MNFVMSRQIGTANRLRLEIRLLSLHPDAGSIRILPVQDEWAAILICYEQLIPWPAVIFTVERPTVGVGFTKEILSFPRSGERICGYGLGFEELRGSARFRNNSAVSSGSMRWKRSPPRR